MPTLDTSHFLLTLADDWHSVDTGEADRFIFESPLRDTSVTVSIERVEVPPEDMDGVAERFVQFRIDSHYAGAQQHGWLFEMVEPDIADQPFGRVIAYHGHLLAGGRFAFTGLVLPKGVISVFVESASASEDALAETLDEIAGGMAI